MRARINVVACVVYHGERRCVCVCVCGGGVVSVLNYIVGGWVWNV